MAEATILVVRVDDDSTDSVEFPEQFSEQVAWAYRLNAELQWAKWHLTHPKKLEQPQ